MTEPVPEFGEEWGSEKGEVAHETSENSWKDDGLKESREEKQCRADGGDPANRKWNGDGKEEDLLVRKSGSEAKEERVVQVEGIDGNRGAEKCDEDNGGNPQK